MYLGGRDGIVANPEHGVDHDRLGTEQHGRRRSGPGVNDAAGAGRNGARLSRARSGLSGNLLEFTL